MRARVRALVAGGTLALAGCTDAATRIAYDIEAGAKALGSSTDSGTTVRHEPASWPDGCGDGYALEIGRGASGDQTRDAALESDSDPWNEPSNRAKASGGGLGRTR